MTSADTRSHLIISRQMLKALLTNLLRTRAPEPKVSTASTDAPLRLHIGGQEPHPEWKIVNIMPGKFTDYVRSCTDLSIFPDGSVAEIYASHVMEHLGYQRELGRALKEFNRILTPGGRLRVSVPDLPTLCRIYLDPARDSEARLMVMRMMYGGQIDDGDFHFVGLNEELMRSYLQRAGFSDIQRVADLGLFNDASRMTFHGQPISLNVIAYKPMAAAIAPDQTAA